MTLFNFSQLKSGRQLATVGNKLIFDGGISAADVTVSQVAAGVRLAVGAKFVVLRELTIDQISSFLVDFNNGSELLVGDNSGSQFGDPEANQLNSFTPAFVRHDQFMGLGGDDVQNGGAGNDLLFGNGGKDALRGDAGNDRLNGGLGNDTIQGGDDNDTVRIDAPNIGNDKVSGGDGSDRLLYGDAASTTRQTLGGGPGEDVLIGGRGGDNLNGGRDDDRIEAGAGRDTIEGGLGADLLEGGAGGDIFRYSGFDSDPAPGLFDRILDFRTGFDNFEMPQPGTEANYIEENRNTDNFIAALDRANQLFVDGDGTKIYVFIAGTTRGWLFADFDGPDTVADFAILLRNGESLKDLAYTDLL